MGERRPNTPPIGRCTPSIRNPTQESEPCVSYLDTRILYRLSGIVGKLVEGD